jgi:hypothetical protein
MSKEDMKSFIDNTKVEREYFFTPLICVTWLIAAVIGVIFWYTLLKAILI